LPILANASNPPPGVRVGDDKSARSGLFGQFVSSRHEESSPPRTKIGLSYFRVSITAGESDMKTVVFQVVMRLGERAGIAPLGGCKSIGALEHRHQQ
jgi:hypothetical protein